MEAEQGSATTAAVAQLRMAVLQQMVHNNTGKQQTIHFSLYGFILYSALFK